MKSAKFKKFLLPGLLILFSVLFIISAVVIITYTKESFDQKGKYDALADMVNKVQQQQVQLGQTAPSIPVLPGQIAPPPTPPEDIYQEIPHPDTEEKISILAEYADIFKLNTDMVGWIKIDDTKISYPVVQTPNNPNYYLHRDFYKEDSKHGTIYVAEAANLSTPSDNVTIYGHNMSDGSMFAALHNYRNKEYYEQHPYIHFDTLYEHHVYQIIAVFDTSDKPDTGFAYHTFVDGNTITFNEYVAKCKALSLYDTGVTATYGDKLITLSTCDSDYWDEHGRYVVVAKRIA